MITQEGFSYIVPLLKRAFLFLEDGNWQSADEYCEKVLDIDPENARAYLGKLMTELKVRRQEQLKDEEKPFDKNNHYQRIIRFADEELKSTLIGYIEYINTRNENTRLAGIYCNATSAMAAANTESAYKEAACVFETIREYLDSATLAQTCYEKAEIVRKEAERKAKRNIKILINATAIVCVVIAFLFLLKTVIIPSGKYHDAMALKNEGRFEEAIAAFAALDGYIDSATQIENCRTAIMDCKYNDAFKLMDDGQYTEAIVAFEALDGYKDSVAQIENCKTAIMEEKYINAVALMDAGNIIEAYEAFVTLDGYKNSADNARSIRFTYEIERLKSANVGDYVVFGAYEQDNDTSNGKEDIEWLVLEVNNGKAFVISKYALDCKMYNNNKEHYIIYEDIKWENGHPNFDFSYSVEDITWENCDLREWLNGDFYNSAFSADEKAKIDTTTVSTNLDNTVQDKVFLLSTNEVHKYFDSVHTSLCKPTNYSFYAVPVGTYVHSSSGNVWWWLRSSGRDRTRAARVVDDGGVSKYGNYVDNYGSYVDDYGYVRPALWIELDS